MAVSCSTLHGVWVLLACFILLTSATVRVSEDVSTQRQLQRRVYSVTSGNGTYNWNCGAQCKRKLFFVASCTAEDNFMELIDQDLDVWLTKLEKKLSKIERALRTAPSKGKMKKSIAAIENKLKRLEQKLMRII